MVEIKGWDGNPLVQRVFAFNIKYDLDCAELKKDKLAEMKELLLGNQTFYKPEELCIFWMSQGFTIGFWHVFKPTADCG